jgi:hypothetical protein
MVLDTPGAFNYDVMLERKSLLIVRIYHMIQGWTRTRT